MNCFTCTRRTNIQLNPIHHIPSWTRNTIIVQCCCSDCTVPSPSSWMIINGSGCSCRASSQSPEVPIASCREGQGYGGEASDRRVRGRVGGLDPLVALAPTSTRFLGVAELQVETSIRTSITLQLVQNGVKCSTRIPWIHVQSFVMAGEHTAIFVVTEHFLIRSISEIITKGIICCSWYWCSCDGTGAHFCAEKNYIKPFYSNLKMYLYKSCPTV